VVHEVAADLIASVGDARSQQQPRVLDRVRRQHDDVRVDRVPDVRRGVIIVVSLVFDAGHVAVHVGADAADHRPGAQFDRVRPLVLRAAGRVFGLFRADQHAAGVADAPVADRLIARTVGVAGIRYSVAGLRDARDGQLGRPVGERVPDRPPVDRLGDDLIQVTRRQGVHREHVIAGKRQPHEIALLVDIGGHADFRSAAR
jgi:hypothetical protein